MLPVGAYAPRFTAPNQDNTLVTLEQFLGQKSVVLYFFPKDATPGWTTEAREFRDLADEFRKHDAVILGVSLDKVAAHRRFREKEGIPFDLLADPEGQLCRLYNVRVRNLLVVKLSDRVTYVIGKDGKVHSAYSKVNPAGHARVVLDDIGTCPSCTND